LNLTQTVVARLQLPDGKPDAIFFDDKVPGFGLRIRAGGSKTWIYQFKIGPVQQRMVIGKASAMKPEAARKIAEKYHAAVKDGRNPAAEKAVRAAQSSNSFGDLVCRYLDSKQTTLRPRSLVEVRRHLESYAKSLHRLPVISVGRPAIEHLITDLAENSGIVSANRCRSSLSAMYAWALKKGLANENPVIKTDKAGTEKPRDRLLSNDEIKIIWNALGDDAYAAILRLLLLTAARLNEVAGLKWSEIDFERNRITLPSDRVKNKRTHHLPMSRAVRKLLEERPRERDQELVFPRGKGTFSSWTHAKTLLDQRIAEVTGAPLPRWNHHDFRRTAATRMVEDLKIMPFVVEEVLNHRSGHKSGIVSTYNLSDYPEEKADALNKWAAHVHSIVTGRLPLRAVS
jgi:integrase